MRRRKEGSRVRAGLSRARRRSWPDLLVFLRLGLPSCFAARIPGSPSRALSRRIRPCLSLTRWSSIHRSADPASGRTHAQLRERCSREQLSASCLAVVFGRKRAKEAQVSSERQGEPRRRAEKEAGSEVGLIRRASCGSSARNERRTLNAKPLDEQRKGREAARRRGSVGQGESRVLHRRRGQASQRATKGKARALCARVN